MSKAATEKPYHVVTVRLPPEDFAFLKREKATRQTAEDRVVTYTEIFVSAIRKQRKEARAAARA